MKRLLLTPILFAELALLGILLTMVFVGGLPSSTAGLIYAVGAVLALSAVIALALPWEWASRLSLHGALIAGAVLFALPFVWLVGTSFKYPEETFVSPPQWVPAAAHPRDRSPYVVSPAVAHDVGDEAAQAIWQDAKVFLPTGQLDALGETSVRNALLAELLADAPTDGPDSPTVRVAKDQVRTLWDRVYRSFVIGGVDVRDRDGESFAVPPEQLRLAATTGVELVETPDGTLVRYDLADRESIGVTIDIDPAWLADTLANEPPAVYALRMRQDRTWHGYDVAIEHAGERFASDDALHLGDFRWREVAFRPQTQQAIEDAPVGRDERQLGVLPADAEGAAAEPGTRLTLTLHKTGPIAATWAKYTDTYRQAWYSDPYWGRYLFNSLWLVVLNVIGQLFACSMAAFAFSRLRWPGRDGVFVLLLATMMLPAFVTMIPTFLIFRGLGWYNTLLPLWVPAFAGTPFYIFLLRQFMLGIPRELEEAARIDGCSWFGIYGRIVMPLMKPALATVAIFTFMATWNEFMGPLIYLSDERLYPLSLGLFKFRSQYGSEFGMLMAASTLMTLPVIAVFFVCQRYFIQGATLTGLKG